jgi:predicted dehydrogenase
MRLGLIGAGSQGRILMDAARRIPGVKFAAVADIWEYSQVYASRYLEKFEQPVNVYADYREMLDKEKDLDAVLIATPDFMHEVQLADSLDAGLHVYCEKEMSNTIEGARRMVVKSRESGKVVQIGHQRRSNPRYKHALRLVHDEKLLGRVTSVNGQWNRPVQEPLGWPSKYPVPEEVLKQFGYDSMEQFRNWRWYKKYAGGPIADLGSHQIDIYSWFLKGNARSVSAIGGIGYYGDGREWPDNVMVTYEFETPEGPAQGFYQVLNTTSYGGYYETFMGDQGSLLISEDESKGAIVREAAASRRDWESEAEMVETGGGQALALQIGASRKARGEANAESLAWEQDLEKPIHQPHVENFLAAIKGEAELTCPPDEAFVTCVAVLKVNEAIAAGTKLEIKPEDYVA